MKDKIIGFSILTIIVLGAGLTIDRLERRDSSVTLSAQDGALEKSTSYAQSKISINNTVFNVELAVNEDQQSRGLSGRKSIGDNEGMLFIFKPATRPAFWMKDMLFDLDLVWIEGGKVVAINRHLPIPTPNTRIDQLPTYSPPVNVDYVLEIRAGQADNINVGDRVEIINAISA